MNDIMIELKEVKKSFRVYMDKGNTLKERMLFLRRNRYENREILKGISLKIPKGQAVGFIGKNGCGKSTTLKLLTRILQPNEGTVTVRGRVSSLIELGAGFHPDMSGRENIYINATIFGLTKKEIRERIPEIIAFSELEEFIDNPVRTYSSGMYMRLAFAVAINVNADVLLIDEILAVGDVSFQKKCFEKLKEIKSKGTTIAIVSHSMEQMNEICDRLVWIDQGYIREDGDPEKVGTHYLDTMEQERMARLSKEGLEKFSGEKNSSILSLTENVHPRAGREGSGEVVYAKVEILDKEGKPCRIFNTGDELTLVCHYRTDLDKPSVNFNMDFVKDPYMQYCYGSCFSKAGDVLPVLEKEGQVSIKIDRLMLLPGQYYLDIGINGPAGETYDYVKNLLQITVRDYITDEFGPCTFSHKWEHHKGE